LEVERREREYMWKLPQGGVFQNTFCVLLECVSPDMKNTDSVWKRPNAQSSTVGEAGNMLPVFWEHEKLTKFHRTPEKNRELCFVPVFLHMKTMFTGRKNQCKLGYCELQPLIHGLFVIYKTCIDNCLSSMCWLLSAKLASKTVCHSPNQ
jgi:hypothetical protein